MKKGFFRFMSYVSAFTYGAYSYAALNGNPPKIHQWILTGIFGIMFFLMSISNDND